MVNVLISSVYEIIDPIISSATKYSINKIILLRQKDLDKKLELSLQKLKETFKKPNFNLDIKVVDDVYDIYVVSKTLVDVLDSVPSKDRVYINVTGGRKTLSLGMLFGAYARQKLVKEIFYITEETGKIVILPKIEFGISESEKKVLDYIRKCNDKNCDLVITKLAEDIELSRAMVYKVLTEVEERGYITSDKDNKYILTDAGKIALL
jgi:CRISPR locus-related DNA-binding protein